MQACGVGGGDDVGTYSLLRVRLESRRKGERAGGEVWGGWCLGFNEGINEVAGLESGE